MEMYGPKNARKPVQIGKDIGANRRKVHQHTSYRLGADHPVTVGLPGYQA